LYNYYFKKAHAPWMALATSKQRLKNFRLTFWLFATLPAPYKALRSNAGAGNVGEGAVGVKRPRRLNPEERSDVA
jgi:hypothetical protein